MMRTPLYLSQQFAFLCSARMFAFGTLLLCSWLVAFPSVAQTTASVSIDTSSAMGSVPSQGGCGVDSSVYDGCMTNQGLGAALKTGGFNAIRYHSESGP